MAIKLMPKIQHTNNLLIRSFSTIAVLMSIIFVFLGTAISQGTSSIGISPGSGSFAVGSIIDVAVDINATEPVVGGQVHILYDQSRLSFVDMVSTNNPFVNDMGSSFAPGDIKIAGSTNGEGVSGGVRITLKFEALTSGPVTVSVGPESALIRESDMEDVWDGVRPSAQYALMQAEQAPSSSTTSSSQGSTGQTSQSDQASTTDTTETVEDPSLALVEEPTESIDSENGQLAAFNEGSPSGDQNNKNGIPVAVVIFLVVQLLGAVLLVSYMLVKRKKLGKNLINEADLVNTAVVASTKIVDIPQIANPNENITSNDNIPNQGQVITPTVIMPTIHKSDNSPPTQPPVI